ncbi:MAG: hypothetical protein EXS63_05375 [Candidatus Omnitrophica bacterium]|nr:hypothetical protein [Candidatus Omnitrophota bacterium]
MEEKDLEKEGILRVPLDLSKNQEENQRMREYHNANHALWYLTMIVHAITHDRPHQNTGQKTERILAHLSHLREFIQDPGLKHRLMIERIFDALLSETPKSHSQWTHFIYVNWNLIQNFAEHYGHREKCFPDLEYQKIADVVHHRQYFRRWWWKIQMDFLYRKIRFGRMPAEKN